jgi:hypothetical protein
MPHDVTPAGHDKLSSRLSQILLRLNQGQFLRLQELAPPRHQLSGRPGRRQPESLQLHQDQPPVGVETDLRTPATVFRPNWNKVFETILDTAEEIRHAHATPQSVYQMDLHWLRLVHGNQEKERLHQPSSSSLPEMPRQPFHAQQWFGT